MRGYKPSEAHHDPSEMETRISGLYSQVAELVDAIDGYSTMGKKAPQLCGPL